MRLKKLPLPSMAVTSFDNAGHGWLDANATDTSRRALESHWSLTVKEDGMHMNQHSKNSGPTARTEGFSSPSSPSSPSIMKQLVSSMTARERLVVCLKFADDLTLSEIAEVLDTGVAEVERILEHVVERVTTTVAHPSRN